MGVRGLETFFQSQVPNAVVPINILNEINRWKAEHPDQPVVLVFQVVDILYNIYIALSPTEKIYGPAFRRIHKIFDQNFQQLYNAGVVLHFFANDPAYYKDFEMWSRKESEQYSSRIAVIDEIDSTGGIDRIKQFKKEPGATAPMLDLLKICEKYGVVHVCSNSKYIAEVVKHSNETNAMAIVGNNSNFLIFRGNWRYWSCRHIGLMQCDWSTIEYNRSALLECLNLTRAQMPMLATLAGNDFITPGRDFNKKMHGDRFLNLANYVRQIPNVLTSVEKQNLLMDIFGSCRSQDFDTLRSSLMFYATNVEETKQMDLLLVSALSLGAVYYNSLTGSAIRLKGPTFYDLRRADFLPYFDIAMPILKRQIGFVRKHMDDSDYKQVVELRLSHIGSIGSIKITPEYPKTAMPDLMYLTFNRHNDYFNGVRFKLLKWMVFGDKIHLEFSIEEIPKRYMVAVITILYLCKLQQLSYMEVNALFLAIHLTHENDDENLNVPAKVSSRLILVSHLYIFVHNIVVKCFQYVGLTEFIDYVSIDGVLFVHWMNKMMAGDYRETEEALSQIKFLTKFLQ